MRYTCSYINKHFATVPFGPYFIKRTADRAIRLADNLRMEMVQVGSDSLRLEFFA